MAELDASTNRRRHQRFRVKDGCLWVRMEPRFDIVDISESGVSFIANLPFQLEDKIHVILNRAILIEARVIDCRPLNGNHEPMEPRFRVHCGFLDLGQGQQLMTTFRELDGVSLEAVPG